MSDFCAIVPMEQVLRLIRTMAASMSEIPTALRSNYAHDANQIRWHKTGIGP